MGIGAAGRLFSRDKIIESRALNVMGAQVFRTVVARCAYNMRRPAVAAMVAPEVEELRREGIVVWRDFLSAEQFERVRAECTWLDSQPERLETFRHGSTIVKTAMARDFPEGELPSVHRFYDDPRLCGMVRAAEQRVVNLNECGLFEHLAHGDSGNETDPQTELHSDIFFNTHKAWFYLRDVRVEDGPLVYVKRSHHLTLTRLGFVYRDSCRHNPDADPSRRISEEELRRLQAQETVITCPANTLVIVNTCGYHRRLRGQPGRERYALHLSVRANPFSAHGLRARLAKYPGVYDLLRRAKRTLRG